MIVATKQDARNRKHGNREGGIDFCIANGGTLTAQAHWNGVESVIDINITRHSTR